MDEKQRRPAVRDSQQWWQAPGLDQSLSNRSKRRRRQWLLLVVAVIFSSLLLYRSYTHLRRRVSLRSPRGNAIKATTIRPRKAVPLEAHIMSKCPDAKDCLHDLILPAMQRVQDKVDFKLSYIGRASSVDDSVECKHGPMECLGNMIELCAADLYPDPKIYLGFTMCLTREYERIPERTLIEDCALEHGIDFGRLNGCISRDDAYAAGLLRDSVRRSADAGVGVSCTIRLDNKVRCIRDAGRWKDCPGGSHVEDLVHDVEELYKKL